MVATPVLPIPEKLSGAPLAVAVHPKPLCVTGIKLPAIVSVAVRCAKLF
jgi:hypothetical protein